MPSLDPRTRLLLLICVGVLAICLDRPTSLALLFAASSLPLLLAGVPRRWLVRGGVTLLAVMWSTVLSQGLFYGDLPRQPLVKLGPLTIWREGVFWGAVQSLRFGSTLVASLAVAATTSPDRLHAALRALRVPHGLAFLAATALRAVPDTAASILVVRRARARRGRPLLARSPWAWLRLEVALLRPVVAESLRRARALAESLDARGFDAASPRPVRRPLRFARGEPALLVFAATATLSVVAARLLFLLYSAEVLYIPALRPVYGWVRAWL